MILEVQNGSFSYRPGGRQILNGLNLQVQSGQLLAILGPNGAGKTTLLRCVMGFLRWTGGESLLDGVPLRTIAPRLLWRRLAYVPQARGRATASTVEQTVLLGRASRVNALASPGREDYRRANESLERLGLTALRSRRCDELSGGELQMVLIARALASEPECIILDEPESNLDFKNQLVVLQTLEALRRDGMACIFNTHYPDHALRYADRALLLDKTGACRFGSAAEVVTEQSIASAFGVRSLIGQVETDQQVYPGIVPLDILRDAPAPAADPAAPVLAVLSAVLRQSADEAAFNAALHAAGPLLRGRFGMPCPDRDVRVVTLVADAPRPAIDQLTRTLGRIPGVSVKATFPPEKP